MRVLDANGRVITLTNKLGEGGEGAVWASPIDSRMAIKTYHKHLPPTHVAKLATMISVGDASIFGAAAWPSRLVFNDNREPVGFEMSKLSGQKPFHDIIGFKSRLKSFPTANWSMLVHAATNLVVAFAGLHSKSIIVGDVNSNNVVIQADARVMFIDCDSFQIRAPGKIFRCEVGVPDYQPPELQNITLATVDRKAIHDAFGMAVMVFQLLFLGKHPFMGRLPGGSTVAPTFGENIASGNYFYDEIARGRGLQPPPASLTLAAITPEVAALFERAFRGTPDSRPLPREWIAPLNDLKLRIVTCASNKMHRYRSGIACPWCAIERQSAIVYFAAPTLLTSSGAIDESIWAQFTNDDAEKLWRAINAVQPPSISFEPPKPNSEVKGLPIEDDLRSKIWKFQAGLAVIALSAVALCIFPALRVFDLLDLVALFAFWRFMRPIGGPAYVSRKSQAASAKAMLERTLGDYRTACELGEFRAQKEHLRSIYHKVISQRQAYQSEKDDIKRSAQARALDQYLDTFFIRDAKIMGIGPSLRTRMATQGVETALDIDGGIFRINGIGDAKAASLFAWRRQIESRFRFNNSMVENLYRPIIEKHVSERRLNRIALVGGVETLRSSIEAARTRAGKLRESAVRAQAALDQHNANLNEYSRYAGFIR